jgi:hypothetical protein
MKSKPPISGIIASVLLVVLPQSTPGESGPIPGQPESRAAGTLESAKAEALKKYPQLGEVGSELNRALVARVRILRAQKPDFFKDPAWPLKLADEVAAANPKASGQSHDQSRESAVPGTPAARHIDYAPGTEVARLANQVIKESSGIASSRTNAGVFWTHNDSGGGPEFFALDEKGDDLGTFRVKGASATDWEDMAAFSTDKRNFLLLGDIGDNAAKRQSCTLYIVAEPRVRGHLGKPGAVPVAARMEFTYEDGPHNCETLMVDTARKEIILVSKISAFECQAYVLPLSVKDRTATAKRVATLKIPTATGGDISPDNLRAIITTYGDAYEYTRTPAEDWAAAFARAPRRVKLLRRRQGESICYGADGKTLYLTSELLPCPLVKVPPAD